MSSKGVKHDAGKLRFDLLPPEQLEALARVYTIGSAKYGDRNWEGGIKWGRIFAAVMRHLWAFWRGESDDPEDGIPHVIHAAWGCLALDHHSKHFPNLDDRPHAHQDDNAGSIQALQPFG